MEILLHSALRVIPGSLLLGDGGVLGRDVWCGLATFPPSPVTQNVQNQTILMARLSFFFNLYHLLIGKIFPFISAEKLLFSFLSIYFIISFYAGNRRFFFDITVPG